MSNDEEYKLLQLNFDKEAMRKLKTLAANEGFDSHREYGAKILADLVDNLYKKMVNKLHSETK